MCDTHAYTHLARYARPETRREVHSCEIHVIDIDGQSFTIRTDDTGCLVCIDYRMHRCALRESAPIPRVLKRIACMRSGIYIHACADQACTYTRMRTMRAYVHTEIFVKDTTYTYVYRDPSSTIVSPSSGEISTSK